MPRHLMGSAYKQRVNHGPNLSQLLSNSWDRSSSDEDEDDMMTYNSLRTTKIKNMPKLNTTGNNSNNQYYYCGNKKNRPQQNHRYPYRRGRSNRSGGATLSYPRTKPRVVTTPTSREISPSHSSSSSTSSSVSLSPPLDETTHHEEEKFQSPLSCTGTKQHDDAELQRSEDTTPMTENSSFGSDAGSHSVKKVEEMVNESALSSLSASLGDDEDDEENGNVQHVLDQEETEMVESDNQEHTTEMGDNEEVEDEGVEEAELGMGERGDEEESFEEDYYDDDYEEHEEYENGYEQKEGNVVTVAHDDGNEQNYAGDQILENVRGDENNPTLVSQKMSIRVPSAPKELVISPMNYRGWENSTVASKIFGVGSWRKPRATFGNGMSQKSSIQSATSSIASKKYKNGCTKAGEQLEGDGKSSICSRAKSILSKDGSKSRAKSLISKEGSNAANEKFGTRNFSSSSWLVGMASADTAALGNTESEPTKTVIDSGIDETTMFLSTTKEKRSTTTITIKCSESSHEIELDEAVHSTDSGRETMHKTKEVIDPATSMIMSEITESVHEDEHYSESKTKAEEDDEHDEYTMEIESEAINHSQEDFTLDAEDKVTRGELDLDKSARSTSADNFSEDAGKNNAELGSGYGDTMDNHKGEKGTVANSPSDENENSVPGLSSALDQEQIRQNTSKAPRGPMLKRHEKMLSIQRRKQALSRKTPAQQAKKDLQNDENAVSSSKQSNARTTKKMNFWRAPRRTVENNEIVVMEPISVVCQKNESMKDNSKGKTKETAKPTPIRHRQAVKQWRSSARPVQRNKPSKAKTSGVDDAKEILSGESSLRIFDPSPKDKSMIWVKGRTHADKKTHEFQEPRQDLSATSEEGLQKWLEYLKQTILEAKLRSEDPEHLVENEMSKFLSDEIHRGIVEEKDGIDGSTERINSVEVGHEGEVVDGISMLDEKTENDNDGMIEAVSSDGEAEDIRSITSLEAIFNCGVCSALPDDSSSTIFIESEKFMGSLGASLMRMQNEWIRTK